MRTPTATNQQNEQTEMSQHYCLLNWKISLMLQKNILRNVLMWTFNNLWITMQFNLIPQRFYCCRPKVVLQWTRVVQGFCSYPAKIAFTESFRRGLSHVRRSGAKIYKYIIHFYYVTYVGMKLQPAVCALHLNSEPFWRTVPDEMTQ